MFKSIDTFLNKITMYRLLVYVLSILSLIAVIYGFLGVLPFTGISFLISLAIIISSAYVSNEIFARIFRIPTNYESWLITALILFLTISPPIYTSDIYVSISASIIATASKYIFKFKNRHIFNPAAIALFTIGLFGFGNAIWWIGSIDLLIPALILSLLVVRKVRRFQMFFAFLITSIITICLFNLKNGLSITDSLYQGISSWPLIFFGTIMLTEPITTPPTNTLRKIYGALVGILFGLQFSAGPLFASPELALVLGNIFSFIVSSKQKLMLTFKEKVKLAENTYELVFDSNESLRFTPGQYLEWTLSANKNDSRGNRRYFTVASSPTESEIKLGVRFAKLGSSFKSTLLALKPSDKILVGHLAGDFVLPEDPKKPLVFIAGGIGITPFRSMIKYLVDTDEKRKITIFYANNIKEDISYKDIFDEASKKIGLETIYILTNKDLVPKNWNGEVGYLTTDILKKYVKDYQTRTFYLSGPNAMVDAYKKLLKQMGINDKQIVTDYFPGF